MKYAIDNRFITPALSSDSLRPKIVAPPPSFKPPEKSPNFILIKITPGKVEECIKHLKRIKGISGFHAVYGEYDLVLIVRERDKFDRQRLMKMIWALTGVVDVQTLVAAS